MNDLIKKPSSELIDPQAEKILDFLNVIGLPTENILAANSERANIGQNLANVIETVPPEARQDARYLSKFVVGAGFGLFDYSLNAIWNEVIINLRKKASMYGIDIFFDAAVGGSRNRDFYKSEEDLPALKDSALLDTCRKLELISDTTYKKLRHMLEMRNDIGISHPNTYSINAFELLSWLQTCVTDVLNDQPTEAALHVQAFVKNLKQQTQPIDAPTKAGIEQKIGELPTHLCGSLLRTIFGIFVDPECDQAVRKNISLIAPKLWSNCKDDAKYKLGLVLEGYKNNLHSDKYGFGEQFFSVVGGNAFRSNSERPLIVDNLIDELWAKHNGWDNFDNEVPVAANLASYFNTQNDIFDNNAMKLFKTIMACRTGRGVDYNRGVSPRAKAYYDAMLSIAGDKFAPHAMAALTHYELQSKLTKTICREQAVAALTQVKTNVINQRLIECLDYLIKELPSDGKCPLSLEFKKLSEGYINWQS